MERKGESTHWTLLKTSKTPDTRVDILLLSFCCTHRMLPDLYNYKRFVSPVTDRETFQRHKQKTNSIDNLILHF